MRMKSLFFTSKAVTSRVDAATRKVLSKFGAFVRRTARSSIKKAPFSNRKERGRARTDFSRKASLPGNPPYSHTGLLKKFIWFGYEPNEHSVVIGPAKLMGKKESIPEVLEYGGVSRKRNKYRTKRKVGGVGELVIVSGPTKGGVAQPIDAPDGKRYWVIYGKIKTAKQAANANRLNEYIYGAEYSVPTSQRSRPYMGPAMDKEKPKLPSLWANSVK